MNGNQLVALTTGGRQFWSADMPPGNFNADALAVADGFLAGSAPNSSPGAIAFAVDSASGRWLWDHGGFNNPLGVGISENKALYSAQPNSDQNGYDLVQRDARTGKLGWIRQFNSPVAAGPLTVNGTTLIGAGPSVYAIATDTAKDIWRQTLTGPIVLATDGKLLYVGDVNQVVYALQL
jgi:PQQ-like domain